MHRNCILGGVTKWSRINRSTGSAALRTIPITRAARIAITARHLITKRSHYLITSNRTIVIFIRAIKVSQDFFARHLAITIRINLVERKMTTGKWATVERGTPAKLRAPLRTR